MQILVTGGAGFIGSHLTAALTDLGHSVRVLDNLSTGRRENLVGLPVEFFEGNVEDPGAAERAAAGCAVVFHLAAMVSVPRSIENPTLNHESNVTGTFHVFEAARRAGVRRVVYASSAAVYGDAQALPAREDTSPAPLSPYGAAKFIAEVYAGVYGAAFPGGPEFVGLRYMNVFGPRQDPSSPYSGVLSVFCRSAVRGETCNVFGDGEQTRDFVFVSDVVGANLLAATAALPRKSIVINIGRGAATSLNEVLEMLGELAGRPIKAVHEPARPGDMRHAVADISLAQRCLGYMPQTTLRDGLKSTLDWFREQDSDG
jgi:UDP-glucose 4-epimerase